MREKQNELKKYQVQLNEFKMKISEVKDFFFFYLISIYIEITSRVQFILSCYQISLEQFGHIKDYHFLKWRIQKKILLYRATRSGFEAQEFHARCDSKPNTITIIKNNLNYAFGGYTPSPWNSSGGYINGPIEFLFSLRRNGVSS